MVHFAFDARLLPHGVVIPAAAEKSRLAENAIVKLPAELLVRVTTLAALVVPTAWLAKVKVAGATETEFSPVPLKGTICGECAASSVIVNAPGTAPATVGFSVTVIVQDKPAARVAPQVLALA